MGFFLKQINKQEGQEGPGSLTREIGQKVPFHPRSTISKQGTA